MTIDRAKLRELLAKASPAPWKCSDDAPGDVVMGTPVLFGAEQANGELIAEMRNSLEELLDANEKLEARLAICEWRATSHSVACQVKQMFDPVPCSCGADDAIAALAALDVVEQ